MIMSANNVFYCFLHIFVSHICQIHVTHDFLHSFYKFTKLLIRHKAVIVSYIFQLCWTPIMNDNECK